MAKGQKVIFNTLSDQDTEILKEIIRDKKSRNKNPGHKRYREAHDRFPDAYIIRLPLGGIPGRDEDDIVQPAVECPICFLEEDGDDLVLTESEELIEVLNFYSWSWYNVADEEDETAPVYLKAFRHKQGHWLCEKPPSEYICKAAEDITAGTSGDTEILLAPSGSSVATIDGWNDWMNNGLDILNDTEGMVRYFEYEKKWRWVEAECDET